jgi:HSP20 family protein
MAAASQEDSGGIEMRNGLMVRRVHPTRFVRRDFDRVFDDMFSRVVPTLSVGGTGWVPSLDVSESENEITVRAEIPGVSAEELDISVEDGVLTISGEKKEESEEAGDNFFRKERRFGSFSRSIALPTAVDTQKISAEYDRGVLTVSLAKAENVMPKKIKVVEKK